MEEEHAVSGVPWLEVKAPDGHEFKFATPEDALRYIDQEANKWRWLQDEARQHPTSNSTLVQDFAGRLSGLNPQRPKSEDRAGVAKWLSTRVETYLTFSPAIHDRSALQRFLLDIQSRDQREAFWTLLWLLYRYGRLPGLMRQAEAREACVTAGMTNAWLWEQPVPETAVPDLLANLSRDAGASADEITALRHQARDDAESMRSMLEASQVDRTSTLQQLEESTKNREEELRQLYAATEKKLEENWRSLHRTYDEKLALNAPSKYWREKRESHRKLAISFGSALVLVALAGMAIVACISFAVFGDTKINVVPKWSQAISMTALLVVVVWALKTLIRLTLSHAHLEIDANERRIMILSYLAMLKKADATEEQRTALFSAIFRPTGNGLIPDESVPVPLLDLLKGK